MEVIFRKIGHPSAKSPPVLGMLIVAGAAPAMASIYEGVTERIAVQPT